MKPIVTVLTTVYNGMPYLKVAIESTLKQTYSNFEYLIIDDASTDDSVECILSYNDPRIRLVRNEKNLNTSDSFNKGLSLITTPYVVRLDQDDVSLPDRIKEQIEYLEKNPEISIVCSWEHVIDSNGTKVWDAKSSIANFGEFLGPILLGLCPIWHPSIAFKKDDMIRIGGFDSDFARAEDFEVTAKYAINRLNAAIVPRFHLLQRKHSNSQSALYDDRQASVARRIHSKVLSFFLENTNTEDLGCFLRLEELPSGRKRTKDYLTIVSSELEDLLTNIKIKHQLSPAEFRSLKKVIYKRVGLGIFFARHLKFLPSFLFYSIFYLLSPLQIPKLRKYLSGIYYRMLGFQYMIKSNR
jgi:glycosyltransferase involved in cell wall biosynthesis